MRKGRSRMRRLDQADRVAVLYDGRLQPLSNDRRWRLLEACTRTLRRSATLGLLLLVGYRIRHIAAFLGNRDVGVLRARDRCFCRRPFMHRCDRRHMLNVHLRRGRRMARSIQDQA